MAQLEQCLLHVSGWGSILSTAWSPEHLRVVLEHHRVWPQNQRETDRHAKWGYLRRSSWVSCGEWGQSGFSNGFSTSSQALGQGCYLCPIFSLGI